MRRRAFLASGVALALAPRTAMASAQPTPDLSYLLQIEALQVALYDRARALPLTGQAAGLAGRYSHHEAEHLQRLQAALKAQAPPPPPTPRFSNLDGFLRAAQRVEGLAVSAYNGAIPLVRDGGLRAELASIVQTDARHCAAIRELRGKPTAPRASDRGATPASVQHALTVIHL